MSDTINLSSFSKAVQDILTEYGEEAQKIVDETIVETQKEDTKKLKKVSPKDTGDYRKGWKLRTKETRFGIETEVYNSSHGWLTHLLEHGHAKRGGGRTAAQPHVGPVQDWAEKEILKRLNEKL